MKVMPLLCGGAPGGHMCKGGQFLIRLTAGRIQLKAREKFTDIP